MHPHTASHTKCYKHSIKIDDKKPCLQIRNTTQVNDKCTVAIITMVNMTVITACEKFSRNLAKLYPIIVKYITIEVILLKSKK